MDGITLILGSGGSRGVSFVGALRALEEAKVPIKRIIGVSMGAIVGSAYASGMPLDEIESVLISLRPWKLFRPKLFGTALSGNTGLRRLVERLVRVRSFEELNIPLQVVCTNIQSGSPVTFLEGELVSPVMASAVISGLVDPVTYRGLILVDGGYSNPIPVNLTESDESVVVVDPSTPADRLVQTKPVFLPWIRADRCFQLAGKAIDILCWQVARRDTMLRDIIHVIPEMNMHASDFSQGSAAVAAGFDAMRANIDVIQQR